MARVNIISTRTYADETYATQSLKTGTRTENGMKKNFKFICVKVGRTLERKGAFSCFNFHASKRVCEFLTCSEVL